jgi:hypothetical protein
LPALQTGKTGRILGSNAGVKKTNCGIRGKERSIRPRPAGHCPGSAGSLQSHDDILKALERIGDLHQKGILSDDEFKSKKAELLSRL